MFLHQMGIHAETISYKVLQGSLKSSGRIRLVKKTSGIQGIMINEYTKNDCSEILYVVNDAAVKYKNIIPDNCWH